MSKLYTSKAILKSLNKAGFQKVSQKGSHIKLRGVSKGRILTVIIPNHKVIAKGTFSSILRQAEMTKTEFENFL